MPLEALRYDITPVGLHYLLIHFDIPMVEASGYELSVGGHVRNRMRLSIDELMARPSTTVAVTLECAGNGRARLQPRPMSQPWLSVPGWYGMTHVKWLRSIMVIDQAFAGYQQATAYHRRTEAGDAGVPVTRMLPRALMVPPGVPDFMSRTRFVEPTTLQIEGRAWSGQAPIARVDF